MNIELLKENIYANINKVIDNFVREIDLKDNEIKVKELYIKQLEKEINELKLKLDMESSNEEKKGDTNNDLEIIDKVYLVSKKKKKCVKDNRVLVEREVLLNYYIGKKKNKELKGNIKTTVHFCESCSRYHVTSDTMDELKELYGNNATCNFKQYTGNLPKIVRDKPQKISITIGKGGFVTSSVKTGHKLVDSYVKTTPEQLMQINRTSSTVTNSINKTDTSINLNNVSVLGKLGYTTTISKDARWSILTNKVIPTIGATRTKSFIRWYINFHKKDPKMKNALVEWKFDLEKLNRLYK